MKLGLRFKTAKWACPKCGEVTTDSRTILSDDAKWWEKLLPLNRRLEPGSVQICLCGQITIINDDFTSRCATPEEIEEIRSREAWSSIRHILWEYERQFKRGDSP